MMRSKLFATCVGVLCTALWLSTASAATNFSINLDESQADAGGGTESPATGTGAAQLNDLGGGDFELAYSVTFSSHLDFSGVASVASNSGSSTVSNLHFHAAPRNVNGGVVYGLYVPSHDFDGGVSAILNADNTTTISGAWGPNDGNPVGNLISSYLTELQGASAGQDIGLYLNVHTAAFGGGEIRGQVVAVPEPTGCVLLLAGLAVSLLTRQRML